MTDQINDLMVQGNAWHAQALQLLADRQTHQDAYEGLADNLSAVARDEIYKEVYVDAVAGDDANPGTSLEPVRTFDQAKALGGQGGVLALRLKSNYELAAEFKVPLSTDLVIIGDGGDKTLSFAAEDSSSNTRAPRITMPQSGQSLHMRSLVIPSRQVAATVVQKHMVSTSSHTLVSTYGCTFTAAAGDDLAFLSGSYLYTFAAMQTAFDAAFDGLYVEGVAAGTDPATLSNCLGTTVATF